MTTRIITGPTTSRAQGRRTRINRQQPRNMIHRLIQTKHRLLRSRRHRSRRTRTMARVFRRSNHTSRRKTQELRPHRRHMSRRQGIRSTSRQRRNTPRFRPQGRVTTRGKPRSRNSRTRHAMVRSSLLFNGTRTLLVRQDIRRRQRSLSSRAFNRTMRRSRNRVSPSMFLLRRLRGSTLHLTRNTTRAVNINHHNTTQERRTSIMRPGRRRGTTTGTRRNRPHLRSSSVILRHTNRVSRSTRNRSLDSIMGNTLPTSRLNLRIFKGFNSVSTINNSIIHHTTRNRSDRRNSNVKRGIKGQGQRNSRHGSRAQGRLHNSSPRFLNPRRLRRKAPRKFRQPQRSGRQDPRHGTNVISARPSRRRHHCRICSGGQRPRNGVSHKSPYRQQCFSKVYERQFFSNWY